MNRDRTTARRETSSGVPEGATAGDAVLPPEQRPSKLSHTSADSLDGVLLPCEGPEISEEPAETAESGGAKRGSPTRVLRHADFRRVFFASFVSNVGGWMEHTAVAWLVASQLSHDKSGVTIWMGYLAAAQLLPTLLLGMPGGLVADRVNRRTLLIVTQAVMMVAAVGFAWAAWVDRATPWVLLGLSLLQGIAVPFNAPAWQVLTPRLVPKAELTDAITMQGIQFNLARVIGPAVAGAALASVGAVPLFLFNAVGFVLVQAAVMRTPDAPAPGGGGWGLRALWSQTVEGIEYLFAHKGLRAAFLASVVFAFFATPILRILPLFVTNVLEREERTFGVLQSVMGVGAVAGGLLLRAVPWWYPKHHLIPLSVLLGGLSILGFSLSRDVWAAGAAMFFVGWFWMWTFNVSISAMQMLTEDRVRGRVMSVCNMVAIGLMPLGTFAASGLGVLGSEWVRRTRPESWNSGLEPQLGLASVAGALVVAGLVMLTFRTPEVDGLAPGQSGFDRKPGLWRGLTASAHRPQSGRPR